MYIEKNIFIINFDKNSSEFINQLFDANQIVINWLGRAFRNSVQDWFEFMNVGRVREENRFSKAVHTSLEDLQPITKEKATFDNVTIDQGYKRTILYNPLWIYWIYYSQRLTNCHHTRALQDMDSINQQCQIENEHATLIQLEITRKDNLKQLSGLEQDYRCSTKEKWRY